MEHIIKMCSCGMSVISRRLRYKDVTHCIFDVDGTLINSVMILEQMVKEICTKYGKPYSEDIRQRLFGETKRSFCETIIKDLNMEVTVPDLEDQITVMAIERIPKAPLQKGADRLVSHLYNHKVPMALATNANQLELLHVVKAKPDFFSKFHHMVAVEDVDNRGKPAPDLYLLAAAKFATPANPESCLVFEDSTTGLRAAVAAGMQVVLTPYENVIDEQYINEFTSILPDLLQFKPELYGLPPFSEKS